MNYTCAKCGEAKTKEQMRRFPSGGISPNCLACGSRPRSSNAEPTQKKARTKAKKARQVRAPKPAPTPVLKIEQGYGLDARIDDGYLRLEQTEGDRTDTLMVSKSEWILLQAQFGDWGRA